MQCSSEKQKRNAYKILQQAEQRNQKQQENLNGSRKFPNDPGSQKTSNHFANNVSLGGGPEGRFKLLLYIASEISGKLSLIMLS